VSENNFPFPEVQRFRPASLEELAELVRQAVASRTPIYPIGGGTSLRYGGLPTRPGWGLSLQQLRRMVDYPARDLTITVEAGLPVAELQTLLAQQGQWWPVDAPQPDQATVGGVVACNLNGPHRYAWGSVSDYVLGLTAVDGQGMVFAAGSRVVKNAAGYNLCRLLAGSLGALAVIAQVTLRVQPLPETTAFAAAKLEDWDLADRLLRQLMQSQLLPTAIQLAVGPAWTDDPVLGELKPPAKAWLIVGLEGSAKEVAWQVEQLQSAWQAEGLRQVQILREPQSQAMWRRLVEFPVLPGLDSRLANGLPPVPNAHHGVGEERFLVVQAGVLPSQVVALAARWVQMDRRISVLAHAGHGSLVGYFPLDGVDARRWLQESIFPSVSSQHGHVHVLSAPTGVVLSPAELWSQPPCQDRLMQAIKQRFDPDGILNPGRLGFDA